MSTQTVVQDRTLTLSELERKEMESHNFVSAINGTLSFDSMLKASPSQHGPVLKLHVPLVYSMLPSFLQRLVKYSFSSLAPSWKERQMVILGNYIYRFYDEYSTSIKGSPIPLDVIDAQLIKKHSTDYNISYMEDLPPWCDGMFSVSSAGKTRYYVVATEEEASTWVNSIREGQQECIKRKMGHAEHIPYPSEWKIFDRAGERVLKRNTRIKENLARHELRDTERTIFGEVPRGYVPTGYYN